MSLVLQTVGPGGLNYAQRGLNNLNSSMPDASGQSIILAIAVLFTVGVLGSLILWQMLKGNKQ